VDIISRGLPLFSSLSVMKTFAEGVQQSKEYADFLEWSKQQIESEENAVKEKLSDSPESA